MNTIDEAIDGIVQHVARVVKERDELRDVLRLFKVEAVGGHADSEDWRASTTRKRRKVSSSNGNN